MFRILNFRELHNRMKQCIKISKTDAPSPKIVYDRSTAKFATRINMSNSNQHKKVTHDKKIKPLDRSHITSFKMVRKL